MEPFWGDGRAVSARSPLHASSSLTVLAPTGTCLCCIPGFFRSQLDSPDLLVTGPLWLGEAGPHSQGKESYGEACRVGLCEALSE